MVIEQEPLIFGEGRVWERQTNEPSRAYAAFLVFRNLGHGRSLSEAYKRWRAEEEGKPQGEIPRLLGAEKPDAIYPASNWRRWRERWKWDDRATAWDDAQRKETEEREAAARAAQWEERQRQYEELQKVHFQRLLRVNKLIDGTLESAQPLVANGAAVALPKARTESEINGKTSITELDLLRQLEVLCEEERQLTDDYFAGLSTTEEEDKPKDLAAVVGKAIFEWVPDPSLTDASSDPSNTPRIPASTSFIDVTPDSRD
jgi:hypothetical protein